MKASEARETETQCSTLQRPDGPLQYLNEP